MFTIEYFSAITAHYLVSVMSSYISDVDAHFSQLSILTKNFKRKIEDRVTGYVL